MFSAHGPRRDLRHAPFGSLGSICAEAVSLQATRYPVAQKRPKGCASPAALCALPERRCSSSWKQRPAVVRPKFRAREPISSLRSYRSSLNPKLSTLNSLILVLRMSASGFGLCLLSPDPPPGHDEAQWFSEGGSSGCPPDRRGLCCDSFFFFWFSGLQLLHINAKSLSDP